MSHLTALILAAGYGSRISEITTDPKSLLKVKEKTLMDWHFDALKAVGIRNVVVVTGYKREVLENYLTKFQNDFDIQIARNDDYRVKGNTYSFFYGLEKTHGDFLLFDADLIYETKILKSFVDDSTPNQILVGESSIDDIECAKTMIDRKGFVRMTIDKRAVSPAERESFKFAGEAIGILKFSESYREDMYNSCKQFLSEEKNISKNWEHVMNEFLLNHDMSVHQAASDRWVEIDNKEDLEKAKRLFE
ncbi:MAG: phosphocholine cytidylyltransferase family protein [Bacteriovorax sp.]